MISEFICAECSNRTTARRVNRGSFLAELALWSGLVLPVLFYPVWQSMLWRGFVVLVFVHSLWRRTDPPHACRACGAASLIPLNSPDGQRLSEEHPSEVTYYSFFELYVVRNPRWLIRAAVATIIIGGIWLKSGEPPEEAITADNINASGSISDTSQTQFESAEIGASHSSTPSTLASIPTEEKAVVAKAGALSVTEVAAPMLTSDGACNSTAPSECSGHADTPGVTQSANAQSEKWFPLFSGMFVVRSTKNQKVLLSAGIDIRTNDVAFRILDLSKSICRDDVISDAGVFPDIKINGKYVHALSMCINGSQFIAPETADGSRYFKEQIESGNLVTIETSMGTVLNFKGAPPKDLRARLLASKNAAAPRGAEPALDYEARRSQMIGDARAMVKESWQGYLGLIESIEFGNACNVVDTMSANVAIRTVQVTMEDIKNRAGLVGDPTLSVENLTAAAIKAGKDAADKGACTRLTPPERGRLRATVGEMMR